MRVGILLLLAAVLHAAYAGDGGIFPGYPKLFMGEHVVGQMPSGWTAVMWRPSPKTIDNHVSLSDGVMYVPQGQTKENWTESVVLLTYKGVGTQNPADALAKVWNKRPAETCEHYERGKVTVSVENKYPSVVTSYFCGRNPDIGAGEIVTIKGIIAKNNDLLVATRTLRVKPFVNARRDAAEFTDQKAAEILNWLKGFYLCDKSDSSRACPPGR
jgi:hypothetical protein